MTKDFLSQAEDEQVIIFNIRNRMYGGKYRPDDRNWDVEPTETIELTDVSGIRVVVPLNATCIEKPTQVSGEATMTDIRPPVADALPSTSETGADPPEPLTQLPPQLTGVFYDTLRDIMALRPPLSIVKTMSFDIPRYYVIGPSSLPTQETPIMSIKLSDTRSFNLYKYRVSGMGRRGLYEHIKAANHSNGWIAYPRMERVFLLSHLLTKFMRRTILLELCPQYAKP